MTKKHKVPSLTCEDSGIRLMDDSKFFPIIVNDFKEKNVTDFYREFCKLQADPDVSVIPVVVNSYGGEIYALFAILDIMQQAQKPVATIGIGKAMSCGSVLLAAGTRGYRFAAPNIDVLIHEVSTMAAGKNTDIQNEAKNTDRLNAILMKKLAELCKKRSTFFLDMLRSKGNVDLYLSANDAKRYGLVDHIGIPVLLKG